MMELTWKRNLFQAWKKRSHNVEHLILPLLAIGFVCLADAFLFNPFVLALLYVAYRRSGITYLLVSGAMIVSALIIHPAYGLELFLVSLCYFTIAFLSMRVSFKHDWMTRFFDLGLLSLLLVIVMTAHVPHYSTPILCLFLSLIAFLIAQAYEQLFQSIRDQSLAVSLWQIWVIMMSLVSLVMLSPVVGLILLRVMTLVLIPDQKRLLGIAIIGGAWIMLTFLAQYSVSYLLMILLPCFISYLGKGQKRLVFYLVGLIMTMVTLDPQFYTNGFFYQGLLSAILGLIIPRAFKEWWAQFLDRQSQMKLDHELRSAQQMKTEILGLNRYLEAMDFGLQEEIATPFERASKRVWRRVCEGCDHCTYCEMGQNLGTLVREKLTSADRKQINKDCLHPYKLTLELQQAYQIFLSEESYYLEAIRRKNVLVKMADHLRTPISAFARAYQEPLSLKEQIMNTAVATELAVEDVHLSSFGVEVEFARPYQPSHGEDMAEILPLYLRERYQNVSERFHVLKNRYVVRYVAVPKHKVQYHVYTHAVNPSHCGDTYVVYEENDRVLFLLCDGMGHDEKAEKTSKTLSKAFMTLYRQDHNALAAIEQVNDLFRVSSQADNYSTFDFFDLHLQTLELKSIKAGSAPSYVVHEGKLRRLPVGGLPVGLLDEAEIATTHESLVAGDTIFIVSDGLSEYLDEQDPAIFAEITKLEEFSRALFDLAWQHQAHADDATMIVVQIM